MAFELKLLNNLKRPRNLKIPDRGNSFKLCDAAEEVANGQ